MADIFVNPEDLDTPDPRRPYPNLGPIETSSLLHDAHRSECSGCSDPIITGDRVRADGFGNWIHADCASFANGE